MRVDLPEIPADPERRSVFLQDLLVDLGEALDLNAPWQASLLDDGLTLERTDGGRLRAFGIFGDDQGWRVDTWSTPEDALWTERVRRALLDHDDVHLG